jgi:cytochrome P450
MIFSLD